MGNLLSLVMDIDAFELAVALPELTFFENGGIKFGIAIINTSKAQMKRAKT